MSRLGVFYLCHPSAYVNSVAQSVVVVMCNRSMMRIVSLLSLFWSLVEVHSQTFPYVSFMGQTLANHSYVNLGEVGRPDLPGGGEGVQCITDLTTCCTSIDGPHRGDWYFPDGTRLLFPAPNVDIHEFRVTQSVELRRNTNANSPVGIFRCDIPTNAVHDVTDISVRDAPVYVGLYTATGGDISISEGVAFDPSQLTLTCVSTGGPATTVTWTRGNVNITGKQNETVLNNPVTAQYTHTLTVTTAGQYTCTVANNKPSSDSASTFVSGPRPPTDVTAVQDSPTSITVTWTPPIPLDVPLATGSPSLEAVMWILMVALPTATL
ncbi:hypothetical protein GBAR_LOCUS25209 [Geodia barretti]|uniref:Ig-like domain-containing protein n=1 Tax=Geodia barretti TaxID=519541 RepID=A0AA35TCT9_GEOBA|nr:hypothetical protein GBAR_LOCUS25209 [Geodia barretti]